MGQKDENQPPSGNMLASVLSTLELIAANEYQFHRLLNSQELEKFEEWLKTKYPQ